MPGVFGSRRFSAQGAEDQGMRIRTPNDPRMDHRLNAPCPNCGDPMWLHTNHCLVIQPVNGSRRTFQPCGCAKTAEDFT